MLDLKPPIEHFVFVGPLAAPEAFYALLGKRVPAELKTLSSFEAMFQDPSKLDEPMKSRLNESWEGKFYGAFSLRKKPGAIVQVTDYEVKREDVAHLKGRLAEWDMHDDGWFSPEQFTAPLDGVYTKLNGEFIRDTESLERAKGNYKSDPEYVRFVGEMIRKLRAEYGTPEGQQSTNEAPFSHGGSPER